MGAGSSAARSAASNATTDEVEQLTAILPKDTKDWTKDKLLAALDELEKAEENAKSDPAKVLERVKLFKNFPKDELPAILKSCAEVEFEPGAKIVNQGDDGSEFFIIKSGTAKVEVNGNMVASLKSGAYFGENALLHDEVRNASIICQAKMIALKMTREQFDKLDHSKLQFAKRGAVDDHKKANAPVQPPSEKSASEVARIAEAMKQNVNLNTMITLDDVKIQAMTDLMWKENVPKGTALIKEGDRHADYFYVVNSGVFEVMKNSSGTSAEESIGKSSIEATLGPGTSFGDLALLYSAPRAATVTAVIESSVFVIARQQFKHIIINASKCLAEAYTKYLDKVPMLDPLRDAEKKKMAKALNDFAFAEGEFIFEQGESGSLFYILIDGEVSVIQDGKETSKLKATESDAPYFGEGALLTNEPRVASIKVISPTAKTLSMDKTSFDMLLGTLQDLKERGKDGTKDVKQSQSTAKVDSAKFGQIKRDDLNRLGLLGCGGFGAVEMVQHKTTGETYALKALSKGFVLETGMQDKVMSEKNIQLMCDSPFVVKLYETYNGSQSLYLLLELALGGELYATYNKRSMWGNEPCAKFYVAGTTVAFDHLHERKILYRDLKPENLLLNEVGNVKLTDMGLAKVVVGKTSSTCGTPVYFAPEIISSKGHNEAVDWWTLGILHFELLAGYPPFDAPSPPEIYQKVMKGISKVKFPGKCKGNAESLIKGNCKAEPAERLPMKKGGSEKIKKHKWYEGFDWAAFQNQTMEVPYKPPIKNKQDMTNFSASADDMPPQVPYVDPKNGWDKDFATST